MSNPNQFLTDLHEERRKRNFGSTTQPNRKRRKEEKKNHIDLTEDAVDEGTGKVQHYENEAASLSLARSIRENDLKQSHSSSSSSSHTSQSKRYATLNSLRPSFNDVSSSSRDGACFGTFNGCSLFRNQILPNEKTIRHGFQTLSKLVPPNCSVGLFTTFCFDQNPANGGCGDWFKDIFRGIPELTVISDAGPRGGTMSPVGSATQVYDLLDPSTSRPGSWIGFTRSCFSFGLMLVSVLSCVDPTSCSSGKVTET